VYYCLVRTVAWVVVNRYYVADYENLFFREEHCKKDQYYLS